MVVQTPEGRQLQRKEHFDNRIYTTEWKSAEYQSAGWVHPTGAFKDSTNYILLTSCHTSPRTSFKWY